MANRATRLATCGIGHTGFGNIGFKTGTPLAKFSSATLLKLANGSTTIKAAADDDGFERLTFSVPHYALAEVSFGAQLLNSRNRDFSISDGITTKPFHPASSGDVT